MFIAEMKTSIIDYMRESQRWCAAAAAPVSSFPPLLLHLSLANVGTCAATATHNPLLHPHSTHLNKKRKDLKVFGQHTCSLNKCFAQHGFQIFLKLPFTFRNKTKCILWDNSQLIPATMEHYSLHQVPMISLPKQSKNIFKATMLVLSR